MTTSQARATSHLLTVADLDAEQFAALLDLAGQMKRHPLAWRGVLDGRSVACVFVEPSTLTRVSFEAAIFRLGGLPIVLRPDELQLGRGEPISDTARVLSSYCDAIVVRTLAQSDVLMLAQHASVPVINARTDKHHPCQALADCLTLQERFGTLEGLAVAYVGDDNNVLTSLREAAALTGMDLRIAIPPDDPRAAVEGAHAVYRGTPELMALAAPDAVFDGPQSLVWEQAANRLPTEQALLHALVTGEWEA